MGNSINSQNSLVRHWYCLQNEIPQAAITEHISIAIRSVYSICICIYTTLCCALFALDIAVLLKFSHKSDCVHPHSVKNQIMFGSFIHLLHPSQQFNAWPQKKKTKQNDGMFLCSTTGIIRSRNKWDNLIIAPIHTGTWKWSCKVFASNFRQEANLVQTLPFSRFSAMSMYSYIAR